MLTTTLFAAINAASTVICNGYEIDGFAYLATGQVRLDCGEDTIATFPDGRVEIDEDGCCTLECHAGPEATPAGTGLAQLEFRVSMPLTAANLT